MKILILSFQTIRVTVISISFLWSFVAFCNSTELPSSKDLAVCSVNARTLSELYTAQNEIRQAISDQSREIIEAKGDIDRVKQIVKDGANPNKVNKIKDIIKKYEDRLHSTCPGTGYRCETYLSSPAKNNCKPFTIKTSDKFIFENTTYR